MTDHKQLLELDPSEDLRFIGPIGGGATATLTMTNPSNKNIGFKVMTTVPRLCRVRPNMGIISPQDKTAIEFIFMPFTEPLDWSKHKFMVQSLQLANTLIEPNELETIIKANKSMIASTRLGSSYTTNYKKSEPQAAADSTAEVNEKEQELKDKIEDLEEALSSEKEKNDKYQKELADVKHKFQWTEEELKKKYETAKEASKREYDSNLASLQKQYLEEKEQTIELKTEKERFQLKCEQLEASFHQRETMMGVSNDDVSLKISFWEVSHCDIKINEHIGSGAWGYVARGLYKEQPVAVKCLHPNIVSPHSLKLLKREVIMMAKIRHPCLLLFIGVSFDHPSGSPMIITELMDCSLRDAYKRQNMLSGKSKIKIMIDVACALHYLHTHKEEIIHRDVSSANVLIRETANKVYRGKLSDFGSANFARSAVTAGPGALMYMAPEVHRETLDNTVSHQTTKIDVYSYGILLCEVFASEPQLPFRDIYLSLLESIRNQFPFMYEQILKCTSHNPDNRPEIIGVLCELRKIFGN